MKFKKFLKTPFLQNTSGGCFRNNGIVCMARQHLLEGETKYALNFVLILSQHKLSMCLFNITANVHSPHTYSSSVFRTKTFYNRHYFNLIHSILRVEFSRIFEYFYYYHVKKNVFNKIVSLSMWLH